MGASAPGDVFGEIALLRDVPRTATVRAETGAEKFLTLGRDEYLAAVTGHPGSAAEADVVVATRLAALALASSKPERSSTPSPRGWRHRPDPRVHC